MTFSGRFILNLIQFASAQGADGNKLLELSGISFDELCKEDSRVSSKIYNEVIENGVALTNDSYFGLHSGEYLNLSAAGLISQITQTSATVKEALEYCCDFANLGCRALPMSLIEKGDYYEISFTPDTIWLQESEISVKHTIDGFLAFTLREFHTLTRQRYYPVKVTFSNEIPKNITEYSRIFKCSLEFNSNKTAMYFRKEHIEVPVITSDYNLLRVLVSHATEKLQELEKEQEQGFYSIVLRSILRLVKPEFPTIEMVASNLNISVRTLQRRLKNESKTYQDILDQLREQFAKNYLKNNDLTVSEVAYLLNYSDASSFIRSFKRWTGMTPEQFR